MERGGYASDLLLERTALLDSRDAGLANEIVFGLLRYQNQLDFLIPNRRLDSEVRIALRMGIYQLRYLDRIPRHAAVSESVELVKRARKRSAVGFVNAILRKVNREPVAWPDRSVELSHPQWLLDRWERQFGAEATEAIVRSDLLPPAPYVRVRPGVEVPPGLERTDVPGCFRGTAEGLQQMDIGSQSIVPLLNLRSGQRFLDLCAAPGNKTAQALESGVRAAACDLHASRLAPLKRLGIDLVQLDARQSLPFGPIFDRILVDAPCTGTGTLARNPEIKWRLREEEIFELQLKQRLILENALAVLKPGGRLVYSTCSLEREENEEVVQNRANHMIRRMPGRDPGDGFFAAVIDAP